jgi:hypothetical protein
MVGLTSPDNGVSRVIGFGRVSFPGFWSRKGTADQMPHLSTIDVISVTVQLLEAAANHPLATTWPSLRDLFVTQTTIKAPAIPVETDFEELALAGYAMHSADGLTFVADVAGFSVNLTLARSVDPPATWNPECASVHSEVFRGRVPSLCEVTINDQRATALVDVPAQVSRPLGGVDARRGTALNQIDAFVAALQLGQILLYDLDNVARADSQTLWMRTTTLRALGQPRQVHAHPIEATLTQPRIRTLRDEQWRLATVQAQMPDLFTVECSVAHRIAAANHREPLLARTT